MKKILTLIMLLVSLATASAKCNWSGLFLSQSNKGTTFTWYLAGAGINTNSCVKWRYMIYDVQTKKIDTVKPVVNYVGYTSYKFTKKGKYKMYLQVWDTCNKCDTSMMREITLQYFNDVKTYESKLACDRSIFEMTKATSVDTCYEYSYYVYNGKSYFNNSFLMTKAKWDTIKNETVWNQYINPDGTFPDFEMEASHLGRVFDYTFDNKNYRYFVVVKCHNMCNNQDTMYGMKVTTTCKKDTTLSLNVLTKPEAKVIGMYDMLGRKIESPVFNEPYIILYDNGQRRKVVKVQ
jgi:hypothetical protein